MTPNPYVFDTKIKGKHYLLPCGQGITDHLRGISTNESGRLLWEGLSQGENREALLKRLCTFYEAQPDEEALLEQDLDEFLSLLRNQGLMRDNDAVALPYFASAPCRHAKIGPLTLAFQIPRQVFDNYFFAFEITDAENLSQVNADLRLQFLPCRPVRYSIGEILVRNEDMVIADCGEEYLFLPLQGKYVRELRVSKDASQAVLYGQLQESDESCLEEIFHLIRFAFLMTAQEHNLCVVHSASLLYDGKAWLFSGSSGTGKSTHTQLWHENFGSLLLNGDLNLLGMEKGQPTCFGLPWCGTSKIYTAKNYPLGGIVFLKKAPLNQVSTMTPDQEALSLSQRMITPAWTRAQARKNLDLAEALTERIHVFRLECTKDPAAANIMRRAIDESIKSH